MSANGYRKCNDYKIEGNIVFGYTSKGTEFIFDLDEYENIKDYTWFDDRERISTHYEKNKKVMLHYHILGEGKKNIIFLNGNKKDCRKLNMKINGLMGVV